MISYEVPMVLALVGPVIAAGTFSLQGIVRAQAHSVWYIFLVPISAVVFLVSGLAETNLTPFDLVEAESELVAGFTTEYSGMKFALFFLAEFASNFTLGAIATTLFLGGWSFPGHWLPDSWIWFILKSFLTVLLLFHIRGTLPRIRVDQLMDVGWKFLIPAALLQMVIIGAYVTLEVNWVVIVFVNILLVILAIGLGKKGGVLAGADPEAHIREVRAYRRERQQSRRRALL
jgi:NADH-quinone oxidoreductase subunit H